MYPYPKKGLVDDLLVYAYLPYPLFRDVHGWPRFSFIVVGVLFMLHVHSCDLTLINFLHCDVGFWRIELRLASNSRTIFGAEFLSVSLPYEVKCIEDVAGPCPSSEGQLWLKYAMVGQHVTCKKRRVFALTVGVSYSLQLYFDGQGAICDINVVFVDVVNFSEFVVTLVDPSAFDAPRSC